MKPLVPTCPILLVFLISTFTGSTYAGNRGPDDAAQVCPPPPCSRTTTEPPLADATPLHRPRPIWGTADPEDPPAPTVTIRVRVPATAAIGQEVEYRLCVENCSEAAAHHVLVRNPIPAGARFVRANPPPSVTDPELLWRLGTLEGGTKREIVLTFTPTGTDDIHNCARVQFEHGECVVTKIARPGLSIQKEGPSQALLNETLTYKLTLTNTGEGELSNVLLTDILPAGLDHASGKDRLSWIIGNVGPGQSQNVEYQVTARKAGRLTNKAIATAAGGFKQEKENTIVIGEAKLGLTMAGPRKRYLNMPASYQITVSNQGTFTLDHVAITNPLPGQTSFVSASQGGQLAGSLVQWPIGRLEPNESRSVALVLQAQSVGTLRNRATATADHGLSVLAEVTTDFAGVSALSLEVDDTEDPVEVGGTTAYNIIVRNQGTKPVTKVQVSATVPDQMAITRAAGAADNQKQGQKIIYEPITLQAGGEARYLVEVKALRPGDVRFKVELTAEQLTAGPVQQEESTTIYAVLPMSRKKAPRNLNQDQAIGAR